MESEQLITKITQIFQRKDGSEVRIIATATGLVVGMGQPFIDVYHRQSPEHPWRLCSNQPHPNWRSMSVDEYVKHGRPEAFTISSPGEMMKVAAMLGKPMSSLQ